MLNEYTVFHKLDYNYDRNFDQIAEHFARKVYGGLKGEIRLAVLRRDLLGIEKKLIESLERPLKVLDVGAGLAQLSLELASRGHDVTVNDISREMLKHAQNEATMLGLKDEMVWHVCPYQALDARIESETFDLILCHALLEWLASPADIFPFFQRWLAPHGKLSLCFYNPASFIYRNLIMGNFKLLDSVADDASTSTNANDKNRSRYQYQADAKKDIQKSLTPNNPVTFVEVSDWLDEVNLQVCEVSGLRVFHDYAPLKRGGHAYPDEVVRMEVRYSNQEPYKWLGRYLHVVAEKK